MTPLILSKYGIWTLTTLGALDLIAALTNAFNGAILARKPDHYKHFTLMGIIWLAYAGGIGGGVLRDIFLGKVPSALVNPWYIIACFTAAALALAISQGRSLASKNRLLTVMTSFSLPWYAIVGVQAALQAHLGYFAAVLIGAIATTGGRCIVDIACGVTPLPLVRGGHLYNAVRRSNGDLLPYMRRGLRVVDHHIDGSHLRAQLRFPTCGAGIALGGVAALGASRGSRRVAFSLIGIIQTLERRFRGIHTALHLKPDKSSAKCLVKQSAAQLA